MNEALQRNVKIIFTGPVAAGKSTAINAISDIPAVMTDEIATDEKRDLKQNSTVAMDYGILKIPGGETLHLYATPGQERFDSMWDVLVEGGLGLVLLINNNSKSAFEDLDYFLRTFHSFIANTALVIGITNMDRSASPSIQDYNDYMQSKQLRYPVFDVDARDKRDVQIMLQALLHSIR